jgi:hypothetical protein
MNQSMAWATLPLLIGKRQQILCLAMRSLASRGRHNTMKNGPAGPYFMLL